MIRAGKRLAAQTNFYNDSADFYLAEYHDGKPSPAKIEYVASEAGLYHEPSFSLPMDTAQEFFEQLWALGFRSKHDRGGADKLDAARSEHIADLRKAAKLS